MIHLSLLLVHVLLLVHLLLAVHGGRAVALRGVALLHPPRLRLVMCYRDLSVNWARTRARWVCGSLATGGARSLFLCVAFEELEARGKAREPRSAGQRRRVVRNGRSAGPGGRDDYANASSRQQGGGFLLAIFVVRTNLKPTLIAARLELALRKLGSKGEIESAPMSAGNFPKSNFCRRKAAALCTTRASARVVPQTRASRRWGFGR